MPIQPYPVGLIEFGTFTGVFGTEEVMGGGLDGTVGIGWLRVLLLAWEGIVSGLNIVNIAIGLLFLSTDFAVVFLELLCGREPGEERVVGSHFVTYNKLP